MTPFPRRLRHLQQLAGMSLALLVDALRYLGFCLRPPAALAAENLFLRKQLALYQERHIKPKGATHATRIALIWLARRFDWRQALAVVQPATFIRWHRQGFQQFWRWKSTRGRPPIPAELRVLIRRMARDNPTWGEDVTAHPTALWALQQLREAIPSAHAYRFLIHDRDSIFSHQLDEHVRHMGLRILKTPPQSPQANALCERLLGTLRRECLDYLIPLSENHLRYILKAWVPHYNAGRPHMALGPGIPQPPPSLLVPRQEHRHRMPEYLRVVTRPILGGLHHEYGLEQKAA